VAVGDELVELVDERDVVVEVVTRAEMRRRGSDGRHRAVYVAVVTSAGELVVHQRAPWKDILPSWWDVCFGGVLGVGEAWDAAAVRELSEEAGIDAQPVLLGAGLWDAPGAAISARVYRVDHDGPFTCPDGEVVALDRVPLADVAGWLSAHDVCPDSVDLVLPRLLPPPPSDEDGGGPQAQPAAGDPGHGG